MVDIPLDRASVSGRAIVDRTPVHLPDVQLASPTEFPISHQNAAKSGWRTILAVPLMREKQALGAIILRRRQVRPFLDKQIVGGRSPARALLRPARLSRRQA